jgi:hypothetical protein
MCYVVEFQDLDMLRKIQPLEDAEKKPALGNNRLWKGGIAQKWSFVAWITVFNRQRARHFNKGPLQINGSVRKRWFFFVELYSPGVFPQSHSYNNYFI